MVPGVDGDDLAAPIRAPNVARALGLWAAGLDRRRRALGPVLGGLFADLGRRRSAGG